MRPNFHPELINPPAGDPGVYVDFAFERRAMLFDLGDLRNLSGRKLLRVSDVFVSHAHMDHFIGFDQLLRVSVGRDKTLRLYGPADFIARVEHRLQSYTWNLVHNYKAAVVVEVTEIHAHGDLPRARFACLAAFAREDLPHLRMHGGIVREETALRVRAAVLDHRISSIAYALEEPVHVNVWKNRLAEMGLPVGPWLHDLKAAVLTGEADDKTMRVQCKENGRTHAREYALGDLKRHALRITPGLKIAYVVDAVFSQENARRIAELARGADVLYIEASFLDRDAGEAHRRHHLTAREAGRLARLAGVKRMVPFHYSARYAGAEQQLHDEAMAAFGSASFQ